MVIHWAFSIIILFDISSDMQTRYYVLINNNEII